jgi:iron complex transport system ATP-binding protein
MKLEVSGISFTYGEKNVLDDVSFTAGDGEVIALLGPNGVGKSTLFKCILGFLRPQKGSITVDGRKIPDLTDREKARYLAYIPQSFAAVFNHTVLDTVMMGSASRLSVFDVPGEDDRKKALSLLDAMGIAELSERGTKKISGGERQLMLLARSLMQNARILIMDEPTASLDFANSHRVMRKIRELSGEGYTVIFSTHSPSLAALYSTSIIALRDGRILRKGSVDEIMTSELLSSLYSFPINTASVSIEGEEHFVCVPKREK